LAFSVAVQVQAAGHAGGGRLSPMAVTLNARNELGIGAPIVDGAARLLDSSGALLAEASIPSSPTGAATIGLAWPQESAGRTLELRIDIRDGTGAVRALEATLAL
jgi:hypothetical protein